MGKRNIFSKVFVSKNATKFVVIGEKAFFAAWTDLPDSACAPFDVSGVDPAGHGETVPGNGAGLQWAGFVRGPYCRVERLARGKRKLLLIN
ncbi:MAG: hypothetical protein AAGD92_07715 [Pseudomonadota bacterium]